jgi:quercetin 2,3-dioxygenase
VKVLSGQYRDTRGPIDDPHTDVQYLDVRLDAGSDFAHTIDSGLQAFVYVFEGSATLEGTSLPQHTFAVLGDGDGLRITAGDKGARFIVVAGKPIGEPIEQYGPFVMNSQAEIHRAMADFQAGRLVQQKAAVGGS